MIKQGDDSFDRIMREDDSGPDPNRSSQVPSKEPESQDLLSKTCQMLSGTVENLATFKSKMTNLFTK